MADAENDSAGNVSGDPIVNEARKRFKRCQEWQGDSDKWSLEDTKFAWADARNNWQWPDKLYSARDGEDRPSLTINKTRVHNDIVINEAMRNKSSIKIRPTGGEASYVSAQTMQAIIRRIEYISKATIAYRKAIQDQVDGGVGYVLLETAYVSDRSFDQDVFIRICRDPRGIYLDPDIKEPDGADAAYGFLFDRMARETFNSKYPRWKATIGEIGKSTLGNDDTWLSEHHIQVAMYYRRNGKKDRFISYLEPQSGTRVEKMASEIAEESGPELLEQLIEDIKAGRVDGKMRDVTNQKVEWYLIAGNVVVEKGDWAGRYIPICRCVGRETVIEGKLDRKGHTRWLIDAQRMLNYNASGQVEYGALQGKTPWIAPVRAIEGQEQWKDANRKNYSVLTYNDIDEEADSPETKKVDRPERTPPPAPSPLYLQGMQDAERQMMMVSGQYQAQMGEDDKQSAASGRAINERQRQGDTATYHFNEGQADMFRHIGMQLIDLIPKIYDTERRLHVLGEDGTKRWILIKPDNPEAIKELKKEKEEAAELEFNPNVGEYDCMADPGPNYATQRQEAWNAISVILQQNMELAMLIGDQLFRYGDFPGADEIAERMKREIQATKPYLFDDEQSPGIAAMQQQVQKLQALNGELMHKLADMALRLRGKDEKRDIEAFNADTKRMEAKINALAKVALTPQQQAQMEHELTVGAHQHIYSMISQANEATVGNSAGSDDNSAASSDATPPLAGARKAPDGQWYVSDNSRPGKYLRVH